MTAIQDTPRMFAEAHLWGKDLLRIAAMIGNYHKIRVGCQRLDGRQTFSSCHLENVKLTHPVYTNANLVSPFVTFSILQLEKVVGHR